MREGPSDDASVTEVIDDPAQHTITLLDWQRESSLDLFVQIHSAIGYYKYTDADQVPTRNDEPYIPTCSVDGAEIGPIPYWSGIVNGLGKNKDVTFGKSRIKTFYVERGNR